MPLPTLRRRGFEEEQRLRREVERLAVVVEVARFRGEHLRVCIRWTAFLQRGCVIVWRGQVDKWSARLHQTGMGWLIYTGSYRYWNIWCRLDLRMIKV